ncbi:hypothetical protein D3Z39_04440 [Anaerotruncus colihominis]|uniref:Uncharacterized protein n=1 Tax=Anaerotruncus colihominis TaxID=169435 RepID=A0A845RK76_9FIRM|nr:hypothetical protein [Anaerotruncus colihominis]
MHCANYTMPLRGHGIIGHRGGSGPRPRIALAIIWYNNRFAVIIPYYPIKKKFRKGRTDSAVLKSGRIFINFGRFTVNFIPPLFFMSNKRVKWN